MKPTLKVQLRQTRKALREFCNDIEAAGIENLRSDWPDLLVTYEHAKHAMGEKHESEIIRQSYPEEKCPDCNAEPIPRWIIEGDGCQNCGHVFCVPRKND